MEGKFQGSMEYDWRATFSFIIYIGGVTIMYVFSQSIIDCKHDNFESTALFNIYVIQWVSSMGANFVGILIYIIHTTCSLLGSDQRLR